MRPKRTLLFCIALLWTACSASLQAQTLDPAFQPTVLKLPYLGGLQTGVQRLAVQPDGKVIIIGGFDFVNGTLASKIQRLNANGTADATFNPGVIGANGFIAAVALQPDGRILIAGGFTSYNGTPALALARLNANGTLDPSFASLPATGVGLRQLGSLAVQPDGKILVGGTNSFTPGQAGALVRLNPDGTADGTFSIGTGTTSGVVNTVLVQADGRIVVGGSFSNFSGQAGSLARLNANGSLDATFGIGTGTNTGSVSTLAQQPDGKLLVGGSFSQINGQAAPGIARLLANGTPDPAFTPGTGATTATGAASVIQSLVLLPNGSIVVAGNFAQFNGVARNRVARLLPNGTLDAAFATGAGANNTVTALGALPSGQVLAVGNLTQYDGVAKTGVALLSATGADDPSFATLVEGKGSINQAVPLPSGQLLVQGNFVSFNGAVAPGAATDVRRVNANGTLDNTFSVAAPVGTSLVGVQPNGSFYLLSRLSISRVLPSGATDNTFTTQAFLPTSAGLQTLVVQPDGKVIALGSFTSYGGAARNGIVRLLPNGSLDASYVPPVGTVVRTYSNPFLLSNGKLLVAYTEATGGAAGTQLVRLNTDGTLDNTFSLGAGPTAGSGFTVFPQANGELLIFGSFTTFNGQATPYGWVRLTANGAVASTLPGLTTSYSPSLVLPDGRVLAGGGNYGTRTLVRLNTDGSLDNTFTALSTPNGVFIGDDFSPAYVLQPIDNKVIAFGSFRSIGGQVRIGLARLIIPGVTATRAATAARPLEVYPNPVSQRLTVVLPASAAPLHATLLDLTGRTVRRWPLPTQQPEAVLDLDTVAPGVYVLRVAGAAGTYQQKVAVTR